MAWWPPWSTSTSILYFLWSIRGAAGPNETYVDHLVSAKGVPPISISMIGWILLVLVWVSWIWAQGDSQQWSVYRCTMFRPIHPITRISIFLSHPAWTLQFFPAQAFWRISVCFLRPGFPTTCHGLQQRSWVAASFLQWVLFSTQTHMGTISNYRVIAKMNFR